MHIEHKSKTQVSKNLVATIWYGYILQPKYNQDNLCASLKL
jgi:hypothetical protein